MIDKMLPTQQQYLRGLVRMDIRKIHRNAIKLASKFGEEYDSVPKDNRLEFVYQVYRDLGGDPDRITTMQEEDE